MTGIILRVVLPGFVISTVLAGVFLYITSAEQAKRSLDDARDYITGTEDARDATSDLPVDDSDAVEWLRDFAK